MRYPSSEIILLFNTRGVSIIYKSSLRDGVTRELIHRKMILDQLLRVSLHTIRLIPDPLRITHTDTHRAFRVEDPAVVPDQLEIIQNSLNELVLSAVGLLLDSLQIHRHFYNERVIMQP